MRRSNLARVIEALTTVGADGRVDVQSNAGLAETTGLSAGTISGLVQHLARAGVVEVTPGAGRNGSRVRIARGPGRVSCLVVGPSGVRVAVGDLTGAVLAQGVLPAPEPDDRPLEKVVRAGLRMLESPLTADGPMERIVVSVDLAAWPADLGRDPGRELAREVRSAATSCAAPIDVHHECALATHAEHTLGAAVGKTSAAVLGLTDHAWLGLLVDGQTWAGADGLAGQVGHVTVDRHGPVCRCGRRGCLEALARPWSATRPPVPGPAENRGRVPTLIDAAHRDDPGAARAVDDIGIALGGLLATAGNLLNPQVLVLAGDLVPLAEHAMAAVEIGFRRHALGAVTGTPIVPSPMAGDAALTGGLLRASQAALLAAAHRSTARTAPHADAG